MSTQRQHLSLNLRQHENGGKFYYLTIHNTFGANYFSLHLHGNALMGTAGPETAKAHYRFTYPVAPSCSNKIFPIGDYRPITGAG